MSGPVKWFQPVLSAQKPYFRPFLNPQAPFQSLFKAAAPLRSLGEARGSRSDASGPSGILCIPELGQ